MLLLATIVAYTFAYSAGSVLPISSSWNVTHSTPSLSPRNDTQDRCPRQLLEIAWYCVATLIASSWLSVHPPVPSPGEPIFKHFKARFFRMVRTIIFLEFVIHNAMEEWFATRRMQKQFAEYRHRKARNYRAALAPLTGEEWLLLKTSEWKRKHGFFLLMRGFVLRDKMGEESYLGWTAFMEHYKAGHIDLSDITEATIDDHSKVDWLGRGIAVLQLLWFIVQSIVRIVDSKLALSELEVVTASLATLSFVLHGLWRHKPFNVGIPIVIILPNSTPRPSDYGDILHRWENMQDTTFRAKLKAVGQWIDPRVKGSRSYISTKNRTVRKEMKLSYRITIFFNYINAGRIDDAMKAYMAKLANYYFASRVILDEQVLPMNDVARYRMAWAFFITATIFGAIHCIGWSDNVSFSSLFIQRLWQSSSVVITASPILWACNYLLCHARDKYRYRNDSNNVFAFKFVLAFEYIAAFSREIYIYCRFIIAVIAIIELRHAPPGVLASINWAGVLPYIH